MLHLAHSTADIIKIVSIKKIFHYIKKCDIMIL